MQRRLPRAERRAQLIEVATAKFGEGGFHPTSMDDIAEAAGITKPVLYQHFASKEDLYIAVIESIGAMLQEHIESTASLETSTRTRISEGIGMFFSIMQTQSSTLRLFFGSEYITHRVRIEVSKVVDSLAESIGRVLLRTRHITPSEALTIGHIFVAAIQASARQPDWQEPAKHQEIVDTLVTLLTDGIRSFRPVDER